MSKDKKISGGFKDALGASAAISELINFRKELEKPIKTEFDLDTDKAEKKSKDLREEIEKPMKSEIQIDTPDPSKEINKAKKKIKPITDDDIFNSNQIENRIIELKQSLSGFLKEVEIDDDREKSLLEKKDYVKYLTDLEELKEYYKRLKKDESEIEDLIMGGNDIQNASNKRGETYKFNMAKYVTDAKRAVHNLAKEVKKELEQAAAEVDPETIEKKTTKKEPSKKETASKKEKQKTTAQTPTDESLDDSLKQVAKNGANAGRETTRAMDDVQKGAKDAASSVIDLNDALKSMKSIFQSLGKEGLTSALGDLSLKQIQDIIKNSKELNPEGKGISKLKKNDLINMISSNIAATSVTQQAPVTQPNTESPIDPTTASSISAVGDAAESSSKSVDKLKQELDELEKTLNIVKGFRGLAHFEDIADREKYNEEVRDQVREKKTKGNSLRAAIYYSVYDEKMDEGKPYKIKLSDKEKKSYTEKALYAEDFMAQKYGDEIFADVERLDEINDDLMKDIDKKNKELKELEKQLKAQEEEARKQAEAAKPKPQKRLPQQQPKQKQKQEPQQEINQQSVEGRKLLNRYDSISGFIDERKIDSSYTQNEKAFINQRIEDIIDPIYDYLGHGLISSLDQVEQLLTSDAFKMFPEKYSQMIQGWINAEKEYRSQNPNLDFFTADLNIMLEDSKARLKSFQDEVKSAEASIEYDKGRNPDDTIVVTSGKFQDQYGKVGSGTYGERIAAAQEKINYRKKQIEELEAEIADIESKLQKTAGPESVGQTATASAPEGSAPDELDKTKEKAKEAKAAIIDLNNAIESMKSILASSGEKGLIDALSSSDIKNDQLKDIIKNNKDLFNPNGKGLSKLKRADMIDMIVGGMKAPTGHAGENSSVISPDSQFEETEQKARQAGQAVEAAGDQMADGLNKAEKSAEQVYEAIDKILKIVYRNGRGKMNVDLGTFLPGSTQNDLKRLLGTVKLDDDESHYESNIKQINDYINEQMKQLERWTHRTEKNSGWDNIHNPFDAETFKNYNGTTEKQAGKLLEKYKGFSKVLFESLANDINIPDEMKNVKAGFVDQIKSGALDAVNAFELLKQKVKEFYDSYEGTQQIGNGTNTNNASTFASDITSLEGYSNASEDFVNQLIASVVSGQKKYDEAMEELKAHILQRQEEIRAAEEAERQRRETAARNLTFADNAKSLENYGFADKDFVQNLTASVIEGTKSYDEAMDILISHIKEKHAEAMAAAQKSERDNAEIGKYDSLAKPILELMGIPDNERPDEYYKFVDAIRKESIDGEEAVKRFAEAVGYVYDQVAGKWSKIVSPTDSIDTFADFEKRVMDYRFSDDMHPAIPMDGEKAEKGAYNEVRKSLGNMADEVSRLQKEYDEFDTSKPVSELEEIKKELREVQVAFAGTFMAANDYWDGALDKTKGGASKKVRDLYEYLMSGKSFDESDSTSSQSQASENFNLRSSSAPEELKSTVEDLEAAITMQNMPFEQAIDRLNQKAKELGYTFDETAKKWVQLSSTDSTANAIVESEERVRDVAEEATKKVLTLYRAIGPYNGGILKSDVQDNGTFWGIDGDDVHSFYEGHTFKGQVDENNIKTLTVDAKGKAWNEIDYNGQIMMTDELLEHAKQQGYDLLEILNVADAAGGNVYGVINDAILQNLEVYIDDTKQAIRASDLLKQTLDNPNHKNPITPEFDTDSVEPIASLSSQTPEETAEQGKASRAASEEAAEGEEKLADAHDRATESAERHAEAEKKVNEEANEEPDTSGEEHQAEVAEEAAEAEEKREKATRKAAEAQHELNEESQKEQPSNQFTTDQIKYIINNIGTLLTEIQKISKAFEAVDDGSGIPTLLKQIQDITGAIGDFKSSLGDGTLLKSDLLGVQEFSGQIKQLIQAIKAMVDLGDLKKSNMGVPTSDVKEEVGSLSNLEKKIREDIPDAIDTKNRAFAGEVTAVRNAVDQEKDILNELVTTITNIAEKLKDAFKVEGVENNPFADLFDSISSNKEVLKDFAEILRKTKEEQEQAAKAAQNYANAINGIDDSVPEDTSDRFASVTHRFTPEGDEQSRTAVSKQNDEKSHRTYTYHSSINPDTGEMELVGYDTKVDYESAAKAAEKAEKDKQNAIDKTNAFLEEQGSLLDRIKQKYVDESKITLKNDDSANLETMYADINKLMADYREKDNPTKLDQTKIKQRIRDYQQEASLAVARQQIATELQAKTLEAAKEHQISQLNKLLSNMQHSGADTGDIEKETKELIEQFSKTKDLTRSYLADIRSHFNLLEEEFSQRDIGFKDLSKEADEYQKLKFKKVDETNLIPNEQERLDQLEKKFTEINDRKQQGLEIDKQEELILSRIAKINSQAETRRYNRDEQLYLDEQQALREEAERERKEEQKGYAERSRQVKAVYDEEIKKIKELYDAKTQMNNLDAKAVSDPAIKNTNEYTEAVTRLTKAINEADEAKKKLDILYNSGDITDGYKDIFDVASKGSSTSRLGIYEAQKRATATTQKEEAKATENMIKEYMSVIKSAGNIQTQLNMALAGQIRGTTSTDQVEMLRQQIDLARESAKKAEDAINELLSDASDNKLFDSGQIKAFKDNLEQVFKFAGNGSQASIKNLNTAIRAGETRSMKSNLNEYADAMKEYQTLYGKQISGETLSTDDTQKMADLLVKLVSIETQWNESKLENIKLTNKQTKAHEEILKAQKENDPGAYIKNMMEENVVREKAIKQYDKLNEKIQKMYKQSDWRSEGWEDAVKDLENALTSLTPEDVTTKAGFDGFVKQLRKIESEAQEVQKSIRFRDVGADWKMDANNKLLKWMQQNKKAARELSEELDDLKKSIDGVGNKADAEEWNDRFLNIQNMAVDQGLTGQTLGERFKNQFANTMTSLATYYLSFQDFIRYGRQAIEVVRDLDTQLTEMRKVSNDSLYTLQQYQLETFDIAERVGTTASQIQSSTADWLRLGKELPDASVMAELSTKLMNVSEFTDIKEATDALVSSTQAYNEVAAGDIVDKLNYIGNNFAVSTDELAQGLQNAAAVLKTQGNDIDEALGLLTAGNLITQDMSKVSAGIRTISLRIAGTEEAKEEIASLGEDIDDFVVRTKSKTDQLIRDYTAVRSNAFQGVSVLDDNGNLRSTYDILLDISKIYKEIQDMDKETGQNRANALVEALAGIVMPEII